MEGGIEEAKLHYIIRDHDRFKFEQKKSRFEMIANYLNEAYGDGTVTVTVKDSYYNMKEKILPHMELIHRAQAAMEAAGVTPRVVPIRGGTDGARLSYEGLPCPNLSTGGLNFHGIHEFIPVASLEKMVEVLVNLAR
jgi:tripeptide aminopeptidase